jgi:Xaa-Pro aminopeptidase
VDHELRRRDLAARLSDLEVDAIFITDPVNVRYLTGFSGSNGQLLIGPEAAWFLTDGRYTQQARHQVAGTDQVTYARSANEVLPGLLSAVTRLGFESKHMTVQAYDAIAAVCDGATLVATSGVVEAARQVKDELELDLLRRAQAATDAAFEDVLDLITGGMSEQQLARKLAARMAESGADDVAFDPIVAFGEHGAEPHHEPGHRMLEEGDLITMDFGARIGGYHADMTRTISFGSAPTELRKIHDVVREAQQAGVDAVRAGVAGSEVDAASRTVIAGAGYGERFVHGLGHGVGLQIHEGPWLGPHHEAQLPAGAVVTVEPGVYVPGLGGVRIEDAVEVTGDGCRVLGSSTRELIEL